MLSIHARVEGAEPAGWEHPSLVQLWGPRFQVYVIAQRDLAVFSLGRFPDDTKGRRRAEDMAARLHAHLGGARMPYGEAGNLPSENTARSRWAITYTWNRGPHSWTSEGCSQPAGSAPSTRAWIESTAALGMLSCQPAPGSLPQQPPPPGKPLVERVGAAAEPEDLWPGEQEKGARHDPRLWPFSAQVCNTELNG